MRSVFTGTDGCIRIVKFKVNAAVSGSWDALAVCGFFMN